MLHDAGGHSGSLYRTVR